MPVVRSRLDIWARAAAGDLKDELVLLGCTGAFPAGSA